MVVCSEGSLEGVRVELQNRGAGAFQITLTTFGVTSHESSESCVPDFQV
jgi:hypothetical protein